MGVVEGHAEHVMDVVGAAALPSLDELRSALDRRRQERSPLLAMLERLIGLEAKLRQYEDGKRFCDAVAAAAGPAALHRVFDGPEQLPTVAELQDPEAWMRRSGGGSLVVWCADAVVEWRPTASLRGPELARRSRSRPRSLGPGGGPRICVFGFSRSAHHRDGWELGGLVGSLSRRGRRPRLVSDPRAGVGERVDELA